MELELIKEAEAPLLERKRVTFSATFIGHATPSNAELLKDISNRLKVDPKLVAIRHVYQKYGEGSAKVIAHVYKTEKDLKETEGRNKKKKKAKEGEAPSEAKAEKKGA